MIPIKKRNLHAAGQLDSFMYDVRKGLGYENLWRTVSEVYRYFTDKNGRGKPWTDNNVKNLRRPNELESDTDFFLKNSNKVITKQEMARALRLPPTAIDKVWDAYIKDKVLIDLGGDRAKVNPAYKGKWDAAIKEAEAAKAKEAEGKGKKPGTAEADGSKEEGAPEEGAPEEGAPEEGAPDISAGDLALEVSPALTAKAEEIVADPRLNIPFATQFKAVWERLQSGPATPAQLKAISKDYAVIIKALRNIQPVPFAKGSYSTKKKRKASVDSWLAESAYSEATRLTLQHRASLISNRVKSPLSED